MFALSLLTFAASASWSQPAGPRRPPGNTYDPYKPLIRQGHLPDQVLNVLHAIRIFPDEMPVTLPGAVRLKTDANGGGPSAVTPGLLHSLRRSARAVDASTPSVTGLPRPVEVQSLTTSLGQQRPAGPVVDVRFRALVQVARTTRLAKRFEEAQTIADEMVRIASTPDTRYLAGLEQATCYYVSNRLDRAIEMLEDLAEGQAPDDESSMWTWYYLGSSLIKLERWPEAIVALQEALARLPEPPCVYWPHVYRLRLIYRVHRCYMSLGDFDKAETYLRQYLAEIEEDTEAEANENRAAFARVVELLQRRMDPEGLERGKLSFGKVRRGECASKRLTICKPWESGTAISCDLPFVTANVLRSRWSTGCLYTQDVSVEILPFAPPGKFRGELTMLGGPPVGGRLTIPLRGEIQ